ncbi:MAG TPA: hypothetical protein VGM44_12510 [Polyangiaceae bacterium]
MPLLGTPIAAHAAAEPHVIVVVPEPRSALTEQALLLIRGELIAVGLRAEIRADLPSSNALGDGAYGLLLLEDDGSETRISAAPPGGESIVTSVDDRTAQADAEVIAVRAVETLRAAVLQYAKQHREGLPEVVSGFARLPKLEAAQTQPHPPERTTARTRWFELFVGPELTWQPRLTPNLGARAGFDLGPRWGFVAATFESTLYRFRADAAAGSAEISRRAFSLALGARFQPAKAWEISTRAGTGYAIYAAEGRAAPGFLGVSLHHMSPLALLGVGGAYYPLRSLAVYLDLSGAVALDAASVRIAGEERTALDRPSLEISSGAAICAF